MAEICNIVGVDESALDCQSSSSDLSQRFEQQQSSRTTSALIIPSAASSNFSNAAVEAAMQVTSSAVATVPLQQQHHRCCSSSWHQYSNSFIQKSQVQPHQQQQQNHSGATTSTGSSAVASVPIGDGCSSASPEDSVHFRPYFPDSIISSASITIGRRNGAVGSNSGAPDDTGGLLMAGTGPPSHPHPSFVHHQFVPEVAEAQQQSQAKTPTLFPHHNFTPPPTQSPSLFEQHLLQPKVPPLEAIIYAEFDNDIGRVIRHQVPKDIFDKPQFDGIASAIIPTEEMRDRMIKLNLSKWNIIGHPVGIKGKKYSREVYIFNMCFVIARQQQPQQQQIQQTITTVVDNSTVPDNASLPSANGYGPVTCCNASAANSVGVPTTIAQLGDELYEPLVQKCAEYLVELEKERGFLSQENHKLPALMNEIFTGLNQSGQCFCTVTDQTTIYLKLCPSLQAKDPPPVNNFSVPIFTCRPAPTSTEHLNRMDVLSRKICPHIDGVRCVKDIAGLVQIDADLVGRCIRNLCYHGCVALLPLFLYSNTYMTTGLIRHFFDSPRVIQECIIFVKRHLDGQEVNFSDICRLYLGLKRGRTLAEWYVRMQPARLNVDERKLIQFGIFYGFVRKVNVYPVVILPNGGGSGLGGANTIRGTLGSFVYGGSGGRLGVSGGLPPAPQPNSQRVLQNFDNKNGQPIALSAAKNPITAVPVPVSSAPPPTTRIAGLCSGELSLDEVALHYGCSPVWLFDRLLDSGQFHFISR